VRPLGDKVRAALFNVIGPVTDWIILEAYAGSGAVGLEALSRGAQLVEAIEANRAVARVIERNVLALGVADRYQLWMMPVEAWLKRTNQESGIRNYDLIIADPPYAQLESGVLSGLAQYLKPGGIMVVSHSSKTAAPKITEIELIQSKVYGDSTLSFYQS
jgi:16S rRNA (guanine966-N2)-methyltransferase